MHFKATLKFLSLVSFECHDSVKPLDDDFTKALLLRLSYGAGSEAGKPHRCNKTERSYLMELINLDDDYQCVAYKSIFHLFKHR